MRCLNIEEFGRCLKLEPEVFFKISVLKSIIKFTRQHLRGKPSLVNLQHVGLWLYPKKD